MNSPHCRHHIAVLELQCRGNEHASFNAALVATVLQAHDDAMVSFHANAEHIQSLREILTQSEIDLRRVSFGPIVVTSHAWRVSQSRVRAIFRLCRSLFVPAHQLWTAFRSKNEAVERSVVLATVNVRHLMLLSLLIPLVPRSLRLVIVLHSVLNLVRRRSGWASRLFRFAAGKLSRRENTVFLVLASTIRESLETEHPNLAKHVQVIEHPFLFDGLVDVRRATKQRRDSNILTFGFIGVATPQKGIGAFGDVAEYALNLADDASLKYRAGFELAGSFVDPSFRDAFVRAHPKVLQDAPVEMLSADLFRERLGGIDYALYLYEPEEYVYAASGALLEALNFGLPIIALNNKYFEHVFRSAGNIGYLCSSLGEVKETIRNILAGKHDVQYGAQQNASMAARSRFTPEANALTLRQIV